MVLTKLEQEEAWIQGWDELDSLMDKYPDSYLLLPNYIEVSVEDAREWIQNSAYESNKCRFQIEHYKGKISILINKVPA